MGAPLAGWIQRALFAQSGEAVDYLRPPGDPGLFGPGSVTWRVHANPVALAVGGVAAVILELAEPRVRTGVWEHSSFRHEPLARMQRTGQAAMLITYGPTAAASARIAEVTRLHGRISGTTPEGEPYSAADPDLLKWVHVTAGYGFLSAYRRYVEPGLSAADQDRYFAEGAPVGRAFGAGEMPASTTEVRAYLERMRPRLRPHPIIGEFLDLAARASPAGPLGRPLQRRLVEAAVDLLPPDLRAAAGLADRGEFRSGAWLMALAAAAGRLDGPRSIPAQALRRAAGRAVP